MSERWHASVDSIARARAKKFVDTHTPYSNTIFSVSKESDRVSKTKVFGAWIQNEREREKRRAARSANVKEIVDRSSLLPGEHPLPTISRNASSFSSAK